MSNLEKIYVLLGKDMDNNMIYENSLIFGEKPKHQAINYLAVPYILLESHEEIVKDLKEKLEWLCNHSVEAGSISKAKASELLKISLIDYIHKDNK